MGIVFGRISGILVIIVLGIFHRTQGMLSMKQKRKRFFRAVSLARSAEQHGLPGVAELFWWDAAKLCGMRPSEVARKMSDQSGEMELPWPQAT
jgi:hypothetical protein